MILDNERQREILLEVMSKATVSGAVAEEFADLIRAVRTAACQRTRETDQADDGQDCEHTRRRAGPQNEMA